MHLLVSLGQRIPKSARTAFVRPFTMMGVAPRKIFQAEGAKKPALPSLSRS